MTIAEIKEAWKADVALAQAANQRHLERLVILLAEPVNVTRVPAAVKPVAA